MSNTNDWGTNKPLAAHGLTSYRYRGAMGWIMIGASDTKEALMEAQRSLSYSREKASVDHLQVWNGHEYVSVEGK